VVFQGKERGKEERKEGRDWLVKRRAALPLVAAHLLLLLLLSLVLHVLNLSGCHATDHVLILKPLFLGIREVVGGFFFFLLLFFFGWKDQRGKKEELKK